jgi:hypothetical protein
MAKIESIKQPQKTKGTKSILPDEQRFIWWKKMYFYTFGIITTILIIPIFLFRRGNVMSGIRMSILFYGFILVFIYFMKRKTDDKDEAYLKSKGIFQEKKKKWWGHALSGLFMALRLYMVYLMVIVWRMTYNG